MTKKITEADVEAKIHSSLKMMFPWLDDEDIKHQTTFSVKLGHGSKEIKNVNLEGRSDIIVIKGTQPLFVCELKAPAVELSDDDAQQGLSYAKLHSPIVPIVVVTNTNEVRIYDTYTESLISNSKDSAEELSFFLNKINLASRAAKESFENVIRVMSGGNKKIVVDLYKKKNDLVFQSLSGDWSDFLYPLQKQQELLLNREFVAEIECFNDGKNLTLVEGKALFGKTNAAFLLSNELSEKEISNIYIDLETSAGLYSEVESILSDYYSASFDDIQIKDWLRSYIKSNTFIFIIDNVDEQSFRGKENEIKEILNIFKGTNCRIILFVNENLPCYHFSSKGRFGANALTNLIEEKEINCINSREFRNCKSKAFNPIMYCLFPELKYPLFFRAAQQSGQLDENYSFFDIIANALNVLNSVLPTSEAEEDFFDNFFEFYFNEYKLANKDCDEKIVADLYRRITPCVLRNEMVEKFRMDVVDKFVNQGYFAREKHSDMDFICLRKPLFLMNELYKFFIKFLKKDFLTGLSYLIDQCEKIPSGDIIAAYCLYLYAQDDIETMRNILDILFNKKAKVEKVSEVHCAMYERNTLIKCKLDDGVFLSNVLPWRMLTLLLSKTDINEIVAPSNLIRYLTEMMKSEHENPRFVGLSINCVEYDDRNECPKCLRHELQDPLILALLTTKKINSWCITILQNDTKANECVKGKLEKLRLLEIAYDNRCG